ncbi:hypothetical protein ACFL21_04325 [Patescibacteria group bacterium]
MNKVAKIIVEFIILIAVITLALQLSAVFAQGFIPLEGEQFMESNIPVPPEDASGEGGKSGQDIAKDVILAGLGYVKVIVVVLGILYITLVGYRLVVSGSEEEEVSKAKRSVTYIIIAFILISMSQDIAKIFDMEQGTILKSPSEILSRVRLFDRQVEIIVKFTKYVISFYAIIMIVRAASMMITYGGNEEETGKAKKNMIYSIGGLLIINIADIFINRVFYKIDKDIYSGITGAHPGVDAKEGVEQLTGIVNLMVTFLGPIALLMLIASAVMYATAGGDEERMNKAKRIIIATVIAIVIIFGAFAVVSTIISGQLNNIGAITG